MNIKPLLDRVIIRIMDRAKLENKHGLILPESQMQQDAFRVGLVVAVPDDKFIKEQIKVGQKVLVEMFGGLRVEDEGIEYYIFRFNEIVASL
jgi:co-chaperonin GroES (HSP10)